MSLRYPEDRAALAQLCVDSIAAQFLPSDQLFAYRRALPARRNIGVSRRYTAIALIGLRLAERVGLTVGLPLDEIERRLVADSGEMGNPGDVALVLWALLEGTGAARDEVADRLTARLRRFEGKLARHSTMELSWALTAASHLHVSRGDNPSATLARSLAQELLASRSRETGLFAFASPRLSSFDPRALPYRRLGTFANQSYSIYGLSTFSEVFAELGALEAAALCARRICALQGELGQWWWVYDVGRGNVAEKFPVFSVHQDGMGPMALGRLSLAGGPEHPRAIERSWSWVFGANELGVDMVSADRHIRRSIRRRGRLASLYHVNVALAAARTGVAVSLFDGPQWLEVLDETRPYHPGWALTFLCDRRLR